jgi:hypothetical protein
MLTTPLTTLALMANLTTPTPPSILAADVQLSWADNGNVRISWSETAPAPNTITLERDGADDVRIATTTADQPNQIEVSRGDLAPTTNPAAIARIVVSEPSGDVAHSADFDRYRRGSAQIRLTQQADGDLAWSFPPDTSVDTTPDDPLDVPAPAQYVVRLLVAGEKPYTYDQCREVYLPPSTVPEGVIENRGRAMDQQIYSRNEWGSATMDWRLVRASSITLDPPAMAPYGLTLNLSGAVVTMSLYENPAPPNGGLPQCFEERHTRPAGVPVILQARNTPTSAWYVVGSGKTDAEGKYRFPLRNPGAREYRTVVPTDPAGVSPRHGSVSVVRPVKVPTRIVSAKFIQPVISYGTKPQAYLWVDPAGSQRAALQFKNASGAWQGLTWKTLYAGRGLVVFNWNRRGTTQFRWWVPGSTTSTGLPVDPVYTSPFSLTVR